MQLICEFHFHLLVCIPLYIQLCWVLQVSGEGGKFYGYRKDHTKERYSQKKQIRCPTEI